MSKTKFFELTTKPLLKADGVYHTEVQYQPEVLWFRPVELPEEDRARVMAEIAQWELVDTYKNEYEDLAYNSEEKYQGERIITDDLLVSFLEGSFVSNQVRGGYLLKNGAFAGVVLKNESVSSYGMASDHSTEFGVLLTDGRKIGRTEYHYFHCSTEVSESRDSVYSLRRKAVAE